MSPAVAARKYIGHLDSLYTTWRSSSRAPQLADLGMEDGDSSEHLSSCDGEAGLGWQQEQEIASGRKALTGVDPRHVGGPTGAWER